jgi:hypothetical protein
MRGGQSAIRHLLRSIGLVSTVGSLSGTPALGTETRSCNALPKPAARDSLCPSPWAIVLLEASDRSTWPTPPGNCKITGSQNDPRALLRRFERHLSQNPGDQQMSLGVQISRHRQGYDLQLSQYDDKGWRASLLALEGARNSDGTVILSYSQSRCQRRRVSEICGPGNRVNPATRTGGRGLHDSRSATSTRS